MFIPYIGSMWILAECGCMPGTYWENKYDSRITLDGSTYTVTLARFIPELATLLLYLRTSLILVMLSAVGLAGIYDASAVTVSLIAILMGLIIYGLPLSLFGYSCWLHFKKRQERKALLVMTPVALFALSLIFYV